MGRAAQGARSHGGGRSHTDGPGGGTEGIADAVGAGGADAEAIACGVSGSATEPVGSLPQPTSIANAKTDRHRPALAAGSWVAAWSVDEGKVSTIVG